MDDHKKAMEKLGEMLADGDDNALDFFYSLLDLFEERSQAEWARFDEQQPLPKTLARALVVSRLRPAAEDDQDIQPHEILRCLADMYQSGLEDGKEDLFQALSITFGGSQDEGRRLVRSALGEIGAVKPIGIEADQHEVLRRAARIIFDTMRMAQSVSSGEVGVYVSMDYYDQVGLTGSLVGGGKVEFTISSGNRMGGMPMDDPWRLDYENEKKIRFRF